MKNALILHGTMGNSNENWLPWLKGELENKGFTVWLPDLPGSNEPKLEKYNQFVFGNKDWEFNSDSVIVGHSSGAVASLALLNELPDGVTIDTVILVSIFEKNSPGGQWEANVNLFDYKFDIEKIKSKAKRFILLISDNDKYCPVEYVKDLGKKLGGEVVVTSGDGHFSASSGGEKYKKLPTLLNYL